jgi:hypothetical protein
MTTPPLSGTLECPTLTGLSGDSLPINTKSSQLLLVWGVPSLFMLESFSITAWAPASCSPSVIISSHLTIFNASHVQRFALCARIVLKVTIHTSTMLSPFAPRIVSTTPAKKPSSGNTPLGAALSEEPSGSDAALIIWVQILTPECKYQLQKHKYSPLSLLWKLHLFNRYH